jgi:hypothetical protein
MRGALGPWAVAAGIALAGCSGEGWTLDFGNRNNGVIGSGNAGRILVTTRPGLSDSTSDTAYLYRATDSLPEEVGSCAMSPRGACGFDLPTDAQYRSEIRSSGRITGRTAWIKGAGKDLLAFEPTLVRPQPFRVRFTSGVAPDSLCVGNRRGRAVAVDSGWTGEEIPDSSDALWIHRAGAGWKRASLTWSSSKPVLSGDPTASALQVVVVQAEPTIWADATVIGIPGATGSSHENELHGTDTIAGLGGAWDSQTVGRGLIRVELPAAVQGKSIRTARLVYQVSNWGERPSGSRGFRVEARRMVRTWNEAAAGYGAANSASLNGATALVSSFGNSWTSPLVALDGTDAQAQADGSDSIPYLSMEPVRIDVRAAVQAWASGETNDGLLTRDLHEAAGDFLDYPVFWMKEARDPLLRPRLLIELAP